ncbi:hypothetical protein J6590_027826 [Homalodisca vitripennis]|nr:hypothetical protein J6590_027826 [Homalodisca vitripennis]
MFAIIGKLQVVSFLCAVWRGCWKRGEDSGDLRPSEYATTHAPPTQSARWKRRVLALIIVGAALDGLSPGLGRGRRAARVIDPGTAGNRLQRRTQQNNAPALYPASSRCDLSRHGSVKQPCQSAIRPWLLVGFCIRVLVNHWGMFWPWYSRQPVTAQNTTEYRSRTLPRVISV